MKQYVITQHALNGFVKTTNLVEPNQVYSKAHLLFWRLFRYNNKIYVSKVQETLDKAIRDAKELNKALAWWCVAQIVVTTLYFFQKTTLGLGLGCLASYICAWHSAGCMVDICKCQRDNYVALIVLCLKMVKYEMEPTDYFTLGIVDVDQQRVT